MPEGRNSPEQPFTPNVTIVERLVKLIPSRFRQTRKVESSQAPIQESHMNTTFGPPTIKPSEESSDTLSDIPLTNEPELPVAMEESEPDKLPELLPILPINDVVDLPPRLTGIAKKFSQELRRRRPPMPEFKIKGVSAIVSTNESVGSGFFEAVQAKDADGYLIGVGAGNVFTMLHCFPDGVVPAGIVVADIDPSVVAVGKLLVKELKKAETATDLQNGFFEMPEDMFLVSIQQLIAEESDSSLKEAWQKTEAKEWQHAWKLLGGRSYIDWEKTRSYKVEGKGIDVTGAMLDKFDVLKQLAMENNVAFEYSDFTSPGFIESVLELPRFDDVTNIIYLSNIVDHITRGGSDLKQLLEQIQPLKAYERSGKKPIYVDTLQQSLNYFLRVRDSLADYTKDAFLQGAFDLFSRNKPEGLLFADKN